MGSVYIASPAGTNKYFTINLLARLHFLHKRATTLDSPDWIVQLISKTVYVVLVHATFRETSPVWIIYKGMDWSEWHLSIF